MKNRDEGLSKVESITTIIVNVGTIVSWVITLITAVTLIAQPQPIVIPGVFELGKPYALTFLVSVLFGYLQVLRNFWHRSRLTNSEAESSFGSYLYASIVKFKRPFILVGFAFILIPLGQLEPVGVSVVLIIFFLIGGTYLLYLRLEKPEKFRWTLDDEFSKRWLKRVRNQLHDYGYVFTSDFNNLNIYEDEVNFAIENYFHRYEFEQGLVLTKHSYKRLFEDHYFLELRFDHLPTRLKKIKADD